MSFISITNRTSGERSGTDCKAQLSEKESDVARVAALWQKVSAPTQRECGQPELSVSQSNPRATAPAQKKERRKLGSKTRQNTTSDLAILVED